MGLFWIGPRSRGRTITVEAPRLERRCVEALAVEITEDGARARAARVQPPPTGPVRWQGRLPTGRYRLGVTLRCDDGAVLPVLSRPLEVGDDDVGVSLRTTGTCGCDASL